MSTERGAETAATFLVAMHAVASPNSRDGSTNARGVVEMTQASLYRDASTPAPRDCGPPTSEQGRRLIAVIGIDGYNQGWDKLSNAVNDARCVLALFRKLGFECVTEPLFDDAATGAALNRLVKDDLRSSLREDDSLIVFFAGHGHTASTRFSKLGYLIPVDAAPPEGDHHTWIHLAHWLSDVAVLPPRHVLVILDSCHSGLALDYDIQRRTEKRIDEDRRPSLQTVSRKVITSADGPCQDGRGPVPGHSLFTGCLLDALRGGLAKQWRTQAALGDEIGSDVKALVRRHSEDRQIPGIGALEFDAGGEFWIPLGGNSRKRHACATVADDRRSKKPGRSKQVLHLKPAALAHKLAESSHSVADTADLAATRRSPGTVPTVRTESWTLDAALIAALDRHSVERARGNRVLSVMGGDAMATQVAWATWAAQRGLLTMVTDATEPAAATADLLAQTPWLRCLPEARKQLAAAARLDIEAINAALDSRNTAERLRWIDRVAPLDAHARVSGWLLSALRESTASVPDLITAPVQGSELLAIACDLAVPTTVLFRHSTPTPQWLEQAIATAAALTAHLPHHSVAVAGPDDLLTRVLHEGRDSNAKAMARQGRITMARLAQWSPGRSRGRTIRVLCEALASDPRTGGRFDLDARVALPDGGPMIEVDLLAPRARIAVELDGWHHFEDPNGYLRDRAQDVRLQQAGYFVIRFVTEDVDDRLASTLDQIANALAERRASGASR